MRTLSLDIDSHNSGSRDAHVVHFTSAFYNTLWRFYKGHRQAMRTLFERTVRTAVTMKLVDLAVQAVDGTKVVANASLNRSYDAKGLRGLLDRVERAIGDLEAENEAGEDTAAAHLPEELADKEVLRAQVRQAMTDLASQERHKRINLTDRDARLMKGRQGIVAGYNAQAMVSPTEPAGGATGMLVTAVDVVDEANDNAMLAPKRRPGRKRRRRWPTPDISPGVTWKNVPAAVSRWWCPSHGSGSSKTHITRTSSPMTSRATVLRAQRDRRSTLFVSSACEWSPVASVPGLWCRLSGVSSLRSVYEGQRDWPKLGVGPHDAVLRRHRAWMATSAAKEAYRLRKQLVEPVFGIIKEQQMARRFLLRGLVNVAAEWTMLATAFNLRTLWRAWRSRTFIQLPHGPNLHPAS